MRRTFYVYILASHDRKLYVGITNNLAKRLEQHRSGADASAFTQRHCIDRLVYYETHEYPRNAIAREKQIKSWKRSKRIELIESVNLGWMDLASAGWIDR